MVYMDGEFLDDQMCRQIRQAMDVGVPEEAEVAAGAFERLESIRRAMSIEVAPDVIRRVEARLDTRRSALAGFFGLALSEREGAGFLRYRSGGFYAAHRDRADVASWPGAARRAVAVVAFLNGSRDAEPRGAFTGGILRLFEDDGVFDIQPRQGLLVAFRADTLHEVTEVVDGVRDAIVDWFYEG
jgi:SM-20-related protein